jgi:tetratricopeptide (TPR) repeat protein
LADQEKTVAELPEGYQAIPEAEQKKAQAFFDKARVVADTGNYEYAIEMYLQGLAIDPENIAAHQAMREISLKRKASGGKDLGFLEKMKLRKPSKDDKSAMLTAEKMLAYDPGNTDPMVTILQCAHRAGYFDTALWIGPILERANSDSKSPDANKFLILLNVYEQLGEYKLAVRACHLAAQLRPDDMDLHTKLKNLGAQETMSAGKYGSARTFRDSIKDMEKQQSLMEGDKDVRTLDSLTRAVEEAEQEYMADPEEAGKLTKLIEALRRTEQPANENRAMELLEGEYNRTRQFRFRQMLGQIKLTQLNRRDRALAAALKADMNNAKLREQYQAFLKEKATEELAEYKLFSENYPTDNGFKFELAKRLFLLQRYDEAIPTLQQVRNDPKYRNDAAILLGRAFLGAGFTIEAAETLESTIKDYVQQGDTRSIEMHYWYGRALEASGNKDQAMRMYSRVAQWNFNYRDVQERVKKLRGAAAPDVQ